MIDKPERPDPGMPCTGCGECCKEKVCKWGMATFPGAEAPCPGLLWEDGRYWCLLVKVEASEKHVYFYDLNCARKYKHALGIPIPLLRN